jgi:hypothetical protein
MAQRKKKVASNRLNIKAKIYDLLIAAVVKESNKLSAAGDVKKARQERRKRNALHDIYRLSLFL